jgi:hypothetical protein
VLQQDIVDGRDRPEVAPTVLRVADSDDEDEIVDRARQIAIANRTPNVAATVRLRERGGSRIRLAFAHAFIDGWAGQVVSRMVLESLASSRVHPKQSTLYDLLNFENSQGGRELSRRNLGRLTGVAAKAAELGVLPTMPPGRSAERVDLLSREHRSTWLRDVLHLLGGSSRTVRAAAMLSLVFLAYCASSGERRGAAFQVPMTNRFSAGEQEFVGLLMMRTWLLAEWVPDETFTQLVRRMTKELVSGCSWARIEPHEMRDELGRLGVEYPPELYFNYSESDATGKTRVDDRCRDTIAWADEDFRWLRTPAGGVAFEFNAYVQQDGATVVSKFDAEFVRRFDVRAFDAGLKGAASIVLGDPELPVAAVCDRIGRIGDPACSR